MFNFLRRLRPEGRGPGKDRSSLQASEARNQALINAIPDLLFELGLDGRY